MRAISGTKVLKQVKRIKKIHPSWIFVYALMLGLVVFTSLPLILLISNAFKPLDELFIFPPQFFVRKPTLQSFYDLLTAVNGSVVPFTRYIFNSLLTTCAIVIGTVIVSSMGAFAVVKYKLPGAKLVFSIVIAALMFSPYVIGIPRYMIINKLGIINTYWALIIPSLAAPYNFFLMKQFFEQFPNEILESARIDGANEWSTFWKIVMPNVKPAWATLVVMSFISNWNDSTAPLLYTTSQAMKTLPLALQLIGGAPGTLARVGAAEAARLLVTVPTIIVFTAMKAKVMETMTHSGIKA